MGCTNSTPSRGPPVASQRPSRYNNISYPRPINLNPTKDLLPRPYEAPHRYPPPPPPEIAKYANMPLPPRPMEAKEIRTKSKHQNFYAKTNAPELRPLSEIGRMPKTSMRPTPLQIGKKDKKREKSLPALPLGASRANQHSKSNNLPPTNFTAQERSRKSLPPVPTESPLFQSQSGRLERQQAGNMCAAMKGGKGSVYWTHAYQGMNGEWVVNGNGGEEVRGGIMKGRVRM